MKSENRSQSIALAPCYPQQNLLLAVWGLSIALVVVLSLVRLQQSVMASDKLLHFLGYLGLSVLPLLGFSRLRVAVAASSSMMLLGVGLEFAQMLTPWRGFELADIVANTLGVLGGSAGGLLLRKLAASRFRRSS